MKPPFIGKRLFNGGFAQFLANSDLIGFSYTLQHSKTVKLQIEVIHGHFLTAYAHPSRDLRRQSVISRLHTLSLGMDGR